VRKHCSSKSKTFWRLYENNAVIKHWFRRNSIKLYNKTGYFLRTETTINNPPALRARNCTHNLNSLQIRLCKSDSRN
jgi:hypothetical protein